MYLKVNCIVNNFVQSVANSYKTIVCKREMGIPIPVMVTWAYYIVIVIVIITVLAIGDPPAQNRQKVGGK